MLVEDVAGLRRGESVDAGDEAQETEQRREQERGLVRARRRALGVAVVCALAVAVLFALREPARPWLTPGRGEEGAFTFGILLVTAYAGFRLAQYLHLRTVARLHRDLAERED